MIESTKDTLEKEGFWTYEQAINMELSDALEEFNAKVARQTESILRGILERVGLVDGQETKEEEIKSRMKMVRRPGPIVAARLFYDEHERKVTKDYLHGLTGKIGLEEIRNSTFIDDYMLDGKSVLFVVHGFRGNVLTVRFVVVGARAGKDG